MKIQQTELNSTGIKFFINREGKEVARGYLYLIENDLHSQPYGLMEDVFVAEELRGQGYGTKIITAIMEEAKKRGCYKLLGTSRYGRENVHKLYEKLGFQDRGKEFRLDFSL